MKLRAASVVTRSRAGRPVKTQPEPVGAYVSHLWPAASNEPQDQAAHGLNSAEQARRQQDRELRQRGGDHRQARLLRGHGNDLLEVERDQDQRRGPRGTVEQRDDRARAEQARREELERDQRVGGATFDGDESHHQDQRDGEETGNPRGGPGVVDRVDGTVHQGDHRAGDNGSRRPSRPYAGPPGASCASSWIPSVTAASDTGTVTRNTARQPMMPASTPPQTTPVA